MFSMFVDVCKNLINYIRKLWISGGPIEIPGGIVEKLVIHFEPAEMANLPKSPSMSTLAADWISRGVTVAVLVETVNDIARCVRHRPTLAIRYTIAAIDRGVSMDDGRTCLHTEIIPAQRASLLHLLHLANK